MRKIFFMVLSVVLFYSIIAEAENRSPGGVMILDISLKDHLPEVEAVHINPGYFRKVRNDCQLIPGPGTNKGEFLVQLLDSAGNTLFKSAFDFPRFRTIPPSYPGSIGNFSPDVLLIENPMISLATPYYEEAAFVEIYNPGESHPSFACAFEGIDGFRSSVDKTCSFFTQPGLTAAEQGKFHIIIIASGYNTENMSNFTSKAETLKSYILGREPFKNYSTAIDIHIYANTSDLGCYRGCSGIDRLMCCTSSSVIAAAAASGYLFDEILVIHNTNTYSGGGYREAPNAYKTNSYTSYAMVYSGTWYKEAVLHELGHSFGNLCDEYSYGSEPYTYTPCVNCRVSCGDWSGISPGCQQGCDAESNYYRPEDSIMLDLNLEYFNQASIEATYSPDGLKKRLLYFLGMSGPFGEFATPTDGSTVSGSIAVTGWALDNIEVASVKIYSGQTYIGDAVFVEGARPDIESAYPDYPFNSRAGWGYMLLTNFLPGGGNGVYTLNAVAADVEGNQVTLGSKTITVDNANAVKPFGAIDTPMQGGTASGSHFKSQGWVLTPMPNKIPDNGTTIKLYIDGVLLKNTAIYNQYRPDIAAYFPGYANSNGAAVTFTIDTTVYANGVHTIFWIVADNKGNIEGIGSRFFSIQNTE